jgi:hypothetical protein
LLHIGHERCVLAPTEVAMTVLRILLYFVLMSGLAVRESFSRRQAPR